MLDLPDLTLVAVYTVAHELTEMAVAECTRHVRFGDVKLFTDRPLRSQGDAIQIEPFGDPMQAGKFTTYEVPRYISNQPRPVHSVGQLDRRSLDVAPAVSRVRLHRGALVVSRRP